MSARKIFVSYARSDQALADEVLRALRRMRVDVWSDDRLTAGDNWSEVLRSRLRDSEYFLLLLTPKALESSWVLQELGGAWALGKRIIPVVTDHRLLDRLPVDLSGVQSIAIDDIDKLADLLQPVV